AAEFDHGSRDAVEISDRRGQHGHECGLPSAPMEGGAVAARAELRATLVSEVPKCADKAPGGARGPSPRDTLTRNGGAALDGATRCRFAAPVTRRSNGPAGRAPWPRPAP